MTETRNVLVVLTDDHGQWATGAYGNREVQTPTLDHLAATGVRMENAFCPSPVCSPARASFFSGLSPSQHGVHDWIDIGSEHDGPSSLADEPLLPELLSEAGYRTALSGKWHCGRGRDREAFDVTANMHDADWEEKKFSLARDRRITDGALRFLREERDAETPFFLFVGYTGTHASWTDEPERLVDPHRGSEFPDVPDEATYRHGRTDVLDVSEPDEARAQYYAAVRGIDEQVGRLVDELESQGRLSETLVVYTADHGHNCGHHGFWGKGNGTQPQNFLEESIRVPLVFSGHEDLDAQVRAEFADHCDLFRTIVEFAGASLPDADRYPGRSVLSALRGGEGDPGPQRQFCEYGDARMVRSDRYKLVRYADARDLLFDLEADPRETTNRIEDGAHADAVERLGNELDAYFDAYADPGTDGWQTATLPEHNGGHEPWNR